MVENQRRQEPGWPAVLTKAQATFTKWRESTNAEATGDQSDQKSSLAPYLLLLTRAKGYQTSINVQNILFNLTVAAFHIAMLEMVSFQLASV